MSTKVIVISHLLRRNLHFCVAKSAQNAAIRPTTANRKTRVQLPSAPAPSPPPVSSSSPQGSVGLKTRPSRVSVTSTSPWTDGKGEDCPKTPPKINIEEINQRVLNSHSGRDKNFKYTDGYPEGEDDREFRLSNHFYRRLYPWKSKEELAAYLCHQIVYHADGVVAINKPFGVGARNVVQKREGQFEMLRRSGLEVPKTQSEFEHSHHVRGVGASNYTLEDVLPIIRQKLGLPSLDLQKSTDKFSSGIAIFSENETVGEKIREAMRMNRPLGLRTYSVYVISTNISKKFLPNGATLRERVGLSMAENPDTKIAHPVVMRDFSKHSIKDGLVKPVTVDLTLIDKNPALNVVCSQLDTVSMRHNFLRVYYASIVSPILGDHLYSSRVAKIGGVMALVPPALARVGFGHQDVSKEVISAIRLRKLDDSLVIPLQAHLQSLTLGNFYGKNKHLKLIAPPTQLFQWTCRRLSLKLPQKEDSNKLMVNGTDA